MNRFLIIHGGLDVEDQVLNDAWIYQPGETLKNRLSDSLVNQKWIMLSIQTRGESDRFYNGLAYHSAVYCPDSPEFGRYQNRMIIFGGQDHENELQNTMYTMNLDKNNLQVIVSNQLGSIPSPRKSCAITVVPSSKRTIV